MPVLGQLSCEVILAHTTRGLKEYSTKYYNQAVETYIAVPSYRAQFHILLKADSYISSGLAVFAYIDGKYQTNRNKRGFTESSRSTFEVLFTGSETSISNGEVVAAGWWFDNVNFVSTDSKIDSTTAQQLKDLGTIEIIVLRCAEPAVNFAEVPRLYKSGRRRLPAMTDGANDSDDDCEVEMERGEGDDRKSRSRRSRAPSPLQDPRLANFNPYYGAYSPFVSSTQPYAAAIPPWIHPYNMTHLPSSALSYPIHGLHGLGMPVAHNRSRSTGRKDKKKVDETSKSGSESDNTWSFRIRSSKKAKKRRNRRHNDKDHGKSRDKKKGSSKNQSGSSDSSSIASEGKKDEKKIAGDGWEDTGNDWGNTGNDWNAGGSTKNDSQKKSSKSKKKDKSKKELETTTDAWGTPAAETADDKKDDDEKPDDIWANIDNDPAGNIDNTQNACNDWAQDIGNDWGNADSKDASGNGGVDANAWNSNDTGGWGDDNNNETNNNTTNEDTGGWGADNNNDTSNNATSNDNTGGWGGEESKDDSKKTSTLENVSKTIGNDETSTTRNPLFNPKWKKAMIDDPAAPGLAPRLRIPQKAVPEGVLHQVCIRSGEITKQKLGNPKYLDSFEKPYAVFRFKYRSRDVLKKKMNIEIPDDKQEKEAFFSSLSKEELLQIVLDGKK